jgi:hypothetical protein
MLSISDAKEATFGEAFSAIDASSVKIVFDKRSETLKAQLDTNNEDNSNSKNTWDEAVSSSASEAQKGNSKEDSYGKLLEQLNESTKETPTKPKSPKKSVGFEKADDAIYRMHFNHI